MVPTERSALLCLVKGYRPRERSRLSGEGLKVMIQYENRVSSMSETSMCRHLLVSIGDAHLISREGYLDASANERDRNRVERLSHTYSGLGIDLGKEDLC
ncbi:hypothetical protein FEAC_13340 [Ferrimicrobium acidiphilum DSM 19497]|uniref:Uncharacterized protein n=1 Tax=Ferrimicrobium acidiphilum DSM 19497 TaxID=1121877 RepID=A0A0D8FUP5_9ACTN|nr:hypothetical protein FEAC_13340 [Ferrimicrobium acidiphilum DSM 19497]